MSTSRLIQKVLQRPTNPSILPIPSTKTGNNVPKSLHKTRRTWRANTTRFDLPSPVLFGASNLILAEEKEGLGVSSTSLSLTNKEGRLPEIKGVKMQTRRIKDVDKAGGLEGMLTATAKEIGIGMVSLKPVEQLSRPSKHFTPFGKRLRSQLFDELHRIRTDLEDARDKAAEALEEEKLRLDEEERRLISG